MLLSQTNKVDKTLINLIHKLQITLMICKPIKQCCVQRLAYLLSEICNKYTLQIKWKGKYLPYKGYNCVKQGSIRDMYLSHYYDKDLMTTAFYKRELNLINLMNVMANRVGRTHKSELIPERSKH